jgi:hypothetical protein
MIKKPIIQKPSNKKDDWSLLKNGLGVFVFLIIAAFFIHVYIVEKKKEAGSNCSRMESDAQNTLAAISSYFADPDHITLPTVDQLIKDEGLWTTYPVKIEGDFEEDIIVTVIGGGECPKGNKYVRSFEGINEWQD